jgi:hypothetical protein
MATNGLGGNVPWVTNEASLMMFYRSNNVRYIMVKAATSDYLFNGEYDFPQFTKSLVDTAHAYGLLIFGYNRSYGENVQGEVEIADFVFNQGADGFVFDAEGEWESSQPWIGDNGPNLAWSLCSQVRSNWPTKFLAHAPFPIISWHASFPYKEFGFWCDAVMPQIYPQGWTGVKSRPSGGINWTDANFASWQNSLYSLPPTNINGVQVYWTNAIKPLAPVNHVYGPNPPNKGVAHIDDDFVTEFVDYLCADPHAVTDGGYQGASFWRADLHGAVQFTNIGLATIGAFPAVVNNIVIDDPTATAFGLWLPIRTFYNGKFYGNGSGTDTNSFGTNYLAAAGTGSGWVDFRPRILVGGEYKVYEWHPFIDVASAAVQHIIEHAGGASTVYADQRTNSGRWSYLGTFPFTAGTNGVIRVMDQVPEIDGVAIADGIKLVFVPPLSPPTGPTGLNAVAISTSQIDLMWTDTSTNEFGFTIYRGDSAGGPYTLVGAAAQSQWSDKNLLDGTTYFYVVRAVNQRGESPDSNEASATTIALPPEPPLILRQPGAFGAPEGGSAEFSVTATGTPPLKYQWCFEGAPIEGKTGSTLVIPQVTTNEEGNYSVVITNRHGSITSTPALLKIVAVGVSGDGSLGQKQVPAEASDLVALSAGAWHFLGLRSDGQVCAWGANWDGQCNVPQDLGRALAVAAGGYHSLAILEDLTVRAWGANENGQCGMAPGLRDVIGIAGGLWHSLAVKTDGSVIAWGDNSWGQRSIPSGLKGVMAVAAGAAHSMALRADGTVIAWGGNYDGMGMHSGQAAVPPGIRAKAIAAGDYHSLALLTNGSVAAWGANSSWQCFVPLQVTNAIGIAAGGAHSLALLGNGVVVAWGANSSGQRAVYQTGYAPISIVAGSATSGVLWPGKTAVGRLCAPTLQPGRFTTVAQTQCGRFYTVEWADALGSGSWTPLRSFEGSGGLVFIEHTNQHSAASFYKLSPQ